MLYIITSLTAAQIIGILGLAFLIIIWIVVLIIIWMNKREKKRMINFSLFIYGQILKGNHQNKTPHELYQEYLKSKKQNK